MLRRGLRAATVGVALAAGLVAVPSPAAWATGSGYYEIIAVTDGNDLIQAYRNVGGFNGSMFANPGVPVGRGWAEFPANSVHFADIDGDTWDDLIDIGENQVVRAWRNNGAGSFSGPVQLATGFTQTRTKFADIDGDGRDEIIAFRIGGEVWAWRNVNGFDGAYTAGYQVIGTGWDDPAWAYFADIDGNGADEIISLERDGPFSAFGDLWAWRNIGGTMDNPYRFGAVRISNGWSYSQPSAIKFGDLDWDERADLISVPILRGSVTAWRNVGGLVHDGPYTQGAVEIAQGFRASSTLFAEVLPRS